MTIWHYVSIYTPLYIECRPTTISCA